MAMTHASHGFNPITPPRLKDIANDPSLLITEISKEVPLLSACLWIGPRLLQSLFIFHILGRHFHHFIRALQQRQIIVWQLHTHFLLARWQRNVH